MSAVPVKPASSVQHVSIVAKFELVERPAATPDSQMVFAQKGGDDEIQTRQHTTRASNLFAIQNNAT